MLLGLTMLRNATLPDLVTSKYTPTGCYRLQSNQILHDDQTR